MPRDLKGSVTVKTHKGSVTVSADANAIRKQVKEGLHGTFPVSSKRPVTVIVSPGSRATVQSASGQVLLVESTDDGFTTEHKIDKGKLRPLREGRYSVLLPPQK